MKKMRFIAAVGAVAYVLTIATGMFVQRLDAATASPQAQTVKMIDVNEMMKWLDVQALPEENWPAV